MSAPILRAGTAVDIPAVLALWQVAAEDAHRPPDSSLALEALITRDPEALIVAVDDTGLVGTVIADGTDGGATSTGWP